MYCNNCFFTQAPVEVLGIIFDEEERLGAVAGDNVKLKLRGIEEEVCLISQEWISHTVTEVIRLENILNGHYRCTFIEREEN